MEMVLTYTSFRRFSSQRGQGARQRASRVIDFLLENRILAKNAALNWLGHLNSTAGRYLRDMSSILSGGNLWGESSSSCATAAQVQEAETAFLFFIQGNTDQVNYEVLKKVLRNGSVMGSVRQDTVCGLVEMRRTYSTFPLVSSDVNKLSVPHMSRYITIILHCVQQQQQQQHAERGNVSVPTEAEGNSNMVEAILRIYSAYSRLMCCNMYGDLDTYDWKSSVFSQEYLCTFKSSHMLRAMRNYQARRKPEHSSNYFHIDAVSRTPVLLVRRSITIGGMRRYQN